MMNCPTSRIHRIGLRLRLRLGDGSVRFGLGLGSTGSTITLESPPGSTSSLTADTEKLTAEMLKSAVRKIAQSFECFFIKAPFFRII